MTAGGGGGGDGGDVPAGARVYVCATPIGNLEDVTPRLRRVLASVDVIACEDTRRTRALLSALEIPAPRLVSHRLDNERESAAGVMALLEEGKSVALVSDAGTPGIADPGVPLVAAAHAAGIPVEPVAGPSALAAALSASGMSASATTFVGFLPRQEAALRELVRARAGEVVVAFESPQRVVHSLGVIAGTQPQRRVCLARELTKLHEQVVVDSAEALARGVGEVRGEVVLVLDTLPRAAGGRDVVDARDVALVETLVDEGVRMKVAARLVAERVGVATGALYDAVVAARA